MIIDNFELSAMPAYSVKSNPTDTAAKPVDVQANLTDTVLLRPSTGNIEFGKITSGMFTGVLPISSGGTGQTTAPAALNALAPAQTGNVGKFLQTDGSGNITWQTINVFDSPTVNLNWNASTRTLSATLIGTLSAGTVRNVTGTAPIAVANGTTTPNISIAAATTSAAGSMSSTDKTRLNDASAVNGLVKCNGAGNFSAAVAGTDYLTSTSGFTQSLANNGWQKLPSGFIIQWFSWSSNTDASQTITFPVTFTDSFSVTVSHALGALTLTNASVTVNRIDGIAGTVTMYGIAVGK